MNREELYTAYCEGSDMTIIVKDFYTDDKLVATEVIGWYYGSPNEEDTTMFTGKLRAEFPNGL